MSIYPRVHICNEILCNKITGKRYINKKEQGRVIERLFLLLIRWKWIQDMLLDNSFISYYFIKLLSSNQDISKNARNTCIFP